MAKRSRKRAKRDQLVKETPDNRKLAGVKHRMRRSGSCAPPWIAPDDMEQWMVDLVMTGKLCGARRSNGEYCLMKPVPHQKYLGRPMPHRCKFHGGAVPVHCLPEDKRQPNMKHGLYSAAVMAGEEGIYAELLKTGATSLDQEIAMLKLRLKRAVQAEAEQEEAVRLGQVKKSMRLKSRKHKEEEDKLTGHPRYTLEHNRELVDYGRRIHQIVQELTKLFGQKALLQGEDMGAEDRATMAREALAQARAGIFKDDDDE